MTNIYRILDANFNRAREALRVIEDIVRFTYNNKNITLVLKTMRNTLGRMSARFGKKLIWARNVKGDVGRDLDKLSQGQKDALVANFKRLQEALRSIEDISNDSYVSNLARRMRFDAYQVEKEVYSIFFRIQRLKDACLYVILTSNVACMPIDKVAHLVVKGGADIIQLREQDIPDAKLLSIAKKIRKITYSKLFIINNRVDIAKAADADGVHLGITDMPIDIARKMLGDEKIIGATTHSLSELENVLKKSPDYVSVGPVFETTTKEGLRPVGFSYLKDALRISPVPVFCIGGINEKNIKELVKAGARRVAICSGIISRQDIVKVTRRIKKIICSDKREV
jgi:thiamine-phosphate pyrophosphorylase